MLGDLNQSRCFLRELYYPVFLGGGHSWKQAMNTWILSFQNVFSWPQNSSNSVRKGFVATQTLVISKNF